ncbi:ribulose-phosphate 3-epimerase [Meiothermus taiwanensis]|jgi:ribulose-phosphate 3-epimerase|uniref:Ribulose-phosphate 3-epimerase n=2 Tax=Meiothermus taiwanensis TaxID=172827 RepID=A0A399EB00_9DEIN|nr:ribulose-phosphate 3-epimerase [Meiothermus taiwanensis]AWR85470.1 ribulose-phosphate 3-epimerase [Meiothermus taiwanensis WR-220]KIQ55632.1 ribulose-phosphate 3-epimerase [Meiothermus taiwanensis]KZK16452.1 ribulose-phosphate 3-epimerase [Meiothermus taiwanensis]RIH80070.1 Ribulose-phosphate 3-epimerase [Meiothermus taiwanensis]
MPKLLVAPSILTADFARLGEQIREAEAAGVDWIHLDVMDGRFVPNLTFGPLVVEAIRKVTALPLDVHLMIVEPERYLADFARAGADWITVHHEATPHAHRAVQQIKELGKKAGLAINPGTPLEALLPLLPELDLALLMSVNPGFGGQKYIPASTERIRRLSGLRQQLNPACLIQVDGGIKPENVAEVYRAGADVVVAGSALFNNRPVAENMEKLMGEVYAAGSR